jgi:hypothetical protein
LAHLETLFVLSSDINSMLRVRGWAAQMKSVNNIGFAFIMPTLL